jgi:hypothetical protein
MTVSAIAEIYGGPVSAGEKESFAAAAGSLSAAARQLSTLSTEWSATATSTDLGSRTLSNCFLGRIENPPSTTHDPQRLLAVNRLSSSAQEIANLFAAKAKDFTQLSDLIARAQGLYSEADNTLSTIMTRLIGTASMAIPQIPIVGAVVLTIAAFLAGGGNTNAARLLAATDPLQEGLFNGLGRVVSGERGMEGVVSPDPFNDGARLLNFVPRLAEKLFFGDKLVVTQPHPETDPIGASHSIGSALANLDSLAASNNDVPYGTVAVQKYIDESNVTRWLVLIPGTTTHTDTAIGWMQNIELMSSDNSQRMNAASVKLVEEALARSGVTADESITLVGHSQGGIVAASAAVGLEKKYNITHIVTAGSPIANHPIPQKTWVTSVENKGEAVSNLDGDRNPQRPTWLTVRGSIEYSNSTTSSAAPPAESSLQGTPVKNAPNRTDITHALNYQRATWKDAESLGSSAVTSHDRHFDEHTRGTLVQTSYYTGRMTR